MLLLSINGAAWLRLSLECKFLEASGQHDLSVSPALIQGVTHSRSFVIWPLTMSPLCALSHHD